MGLTLPRPLSTARIINTVVAGRLPLSAERPAHPKILVLQEVISKPPSRPPEGIRSSGHVSVAADFREIRRNR